MASANEDITERLLEAARAVVADAYECWAVEDEDDPDDPRPVLILKRRSIQELENALAVFGEHSE